MRLPCICWRCSHLLAVPAVTTAAISRLFSLGYLVKHATALERLAEVTQIVFDKTGTLSVPSVTLPDALPMRDASVAKALAQASFHPLSKAVLLALDGVDAAHIGQITEIAGQGVTGQWNGQTVRLGRGAWLGADFNDLGLQIGTAPAWQLPANEAPRSGVRAALDHLNIPCEILTGDAPVPAQKFAADLNLPVTVNMRPDQKLSYLQDISDQGAR